MRHFTSTTRSVYVTYSINDEYANTSYKFFQDFFPEFCSVLEVPKRLAREVFDGFIRGLEYPESGRLTPNEVGSIASLVEFYLSILKREAERDKTSQFRLDQKTLTYIHANLNTGRTIVWVDFVE